MTYPPEQGGPAARTYVIDDRERQQFRVHRSAMADPAVLEEERARIFDTSWLYVGHESEIPDLHDFRTRSVGGRPVIMTRDANGTVQVFVNSCPHRGMAVELRPEGHGRFLKCFYHGWSFATDGRLVSMPDDASYGPGFDRSAVGLARPPMVDSYRGFVFLSWTSDVADLATYLGHARLYIDLVADQSEAGMEIIGGSHLYSMRANWKLLVENSIDGYHALTTHQRYLEMLKASGKASSAMFRAPAKDRRTDAPVLSAMPRPALDLGGGHAVIGAADTSGGTELGGLGRVFPTEETRQRHMARRERLVERHGETWTNRMLGGRNLLVFPNLIIVDLVMGCTVRTFYPSAVDYMEITGWQIAPRDEDPMLRRLRMDNFLTFWGPAGLATPDDVEALERCQTGFRAYQAAPWSDMSRGMGKDHPSGLDELQMRTFWRHWNRMITGHSLPAEDNAVFDPDLDGRPAEVVR
jgi:p-cumate 2,3-dioxygenase alpha subunit